ncbi:MMPL family transporter [Micromonospora luteifusca]|uniref:MMPL family transporter n=1 Tax=Micromonospora luteifusca TaxID=709860 RepID=UPI0033BE4A70
MVIAAGFAGRLGDVQTDDVAATLPGSAESTRVLDVQTSFASTDTLPAVVVYERTSGLTEADRAKVTADAQAFGQRPDLDGQVVGPLFAEDGLAAQIVVPLNLGDDSFNMSDDVVDAMTATARQNADGLSTYVAGPAGATSDMSKAVNGLDLTLLLATMAVVIVILLITYRSPILWLFPLISAGFALVGAQAIIYLLARYADLTVTADGAGILTILVFGAGTDYALLLIARYREELRRHTDRHEAMAVALHRSSPAVIASAATVTAGMLCLLFADMNSTKGLGPVFAIGIVVGLAVMLTLFPALLVTVGRWVFWPVRPKHGSPEPTASGRWASIGRRIARRPRLIWVVTAAALAALSAGALQLDASGLTNQESFRGQHDSITGEEVLARHFAAGVGSPVAVISRPGQAAEVRSTLTSTPGVDAASVTEPVVQGDRAYLEATLTDPADSKAAYDTVDRLRDRVHAVPGADALVGGDTAIKLDVQRATQRDVSLIVPIVSLVVLIILILLLRALVAPLLLIATVALSYGAALGVSALVFKYVFGFESSDSSFPLFAFVFLVSLGIDYNIFLMTRVREEALRLGTRPATLTGLAATGGVITSAGVVLAGTFAVLTSLPLVQLVQIGFAVSFGILLDTLIVRSVLVTALSLDLGRYMWWPSRLFRKADEAAPAA